MHYVVTGGAGFIGSHLCDALATAGHAVTVLDNLSTGKKENLPAGVELIVADCADAAMVADAVKHCDGVFHLAAVASVQQSTHAWRDTTHTNLLATVTVLEAIAKRSAPVPFVYASSAAVFGDPDSHFLPLDENVPTQPLTPYGADKLASELHAKVAQHIFSIPSFGLRFFNVFGPRQDPSSPYSGVISIFANRIARQDGIIIFGDGEQTRDFIYVADVVEYVLRAMAYASANPTCGEVCNIGRGESISVNQLAQTIASICAVEAAITYAEGRAGDIRHSCSAPAKAIALLDYAARYDLEKGLRLTLQC